MKKLTMYGTDASNEISLLEYGLLLSKEAHEDGSGTHFAVYRIGDMFGTGHISETDLNSIVNGEDWADDHTIKSFLDYTGMSKKEWITLNIVMKLSDLISYFGSENIMGTDYSPISEEEAIKLYLN